VAIMAVFWLSKPCCGIFLRFVTIGLRRMV
jgi:hypothetical protein